MLKKISYIACDLSIDIDSDLLKWTHVQCKVSSCFAVLRQLR